MTRADRPTLEQIERELARREKLGRKFRAIRIAAALLLVIIAAAVLITSLLMPVLKISGKSMSPTLGEGDVVVVIKTSKPKNGDIAAFYYNNKILVKRIIASAGDWVNIDGEGNVYVNDIELDEPYAAEKVRDGCDIEFPFQVPEKSFFVLGDNRGMSADSRLADIGCVKDENMLGRVFIRVYPFRKISFIK